VLCFPKSKTLYKTGRCLSLKNTLKAARVVSGVLGPPALRGV